MIFADYPGHLIAAALFAAAGILLFLAYRTEIVRKSGVWRWALTVLQYLCAAIILLIIWDPSVPTEAESRSRNTVLAIFDTSESMSSTDQGASSRLDKALEIFEKSFGTGELDSPRYTVYGFDSACYAADSPKALRRWGPRTNLHSALGVLDKAVLTGVESKASGAAEDNSSRVVGAAVFTDGQAEDKNVGSYFPLKDTDAKILFVGIGSQQAPRDIAVTSVRAPSQVALNTPYVVEVDIRAKGVTNERVTVALLEDDSPVDAREFALKGDAQKITLPFTLGARVLGRHRIAATAKVSGDEPNQVNNRHETTIQVVQAPRLKVLLYSEVANFDFGKVRASLERDKKIDVDIGFDAVIKPDLSQKSRSMSGHVPLPTTKEGFYAYDVIIFGPCDFNQFTAEQTEALYGFVSERGGGLVFLPGRDERDLATSANEKVRVLLPVEFAAEKPQGRDSLAPLTLTLEGRDTGILTEADLKDAAAESIPFRTGAAPKPASAVIARTGDSPIICLHRVGRGRVCYINTYGLFRWYREDLEGGLLRKFLTSLTVEVGRIPSREATVELFASRPPDDPFAVAFDAQVYDQSWKPVQAATVLLEVAGQTIRMEENAAGRYSAQLANIRDESVVAHVQAEKASLFLGEKTITAALACPEGEMDHIELDRNFLVNLAKRVGGEYIDEGNLDASKAAIFQAFSKTTALGAHSAWHNWPLLIGLCVLLSTLWFVRRALGLI